MAGRHRRGVPAGTARAHITTGRKRLRRAGRAERSAAHRGAPQHTAGTPPVPEQAAQLADPPHSATATRSAPGPSATWPSRCGPTPSATALLPAAHLHVAVPFGERGGRRGHGQPAHHAPGAAGRGALRRSGRRALLPWSGPAAAQWPPPDRRGQKSARGTEFGPARGRGRCYGGPRDPPAPPIAARVLLSREPGSRPAAPAPPSRLRSRAGGSRARHRGPPPAGGFWRRGARSGGRVTSRHRHARRRPLPPTPDRVNDRRSAPPRFPPRPRMWGPSGGPPAAAAAHGGRGRGAAPAAGGSGEHRGGAELPAGAAAAAAGAAPGAATGGRAAGLLPSGGAPRGVVRGRGRCVARRGGPGGGGRGCRVGRPRGCGAAE